MNLIQRIFTNPAGRIFVAATLCIMGMIVLSAVAIVLQSQHNRLLSSRWTVELGSKLALVTYSFLMILALSKGKVSAHGFVWASNLPWIIIVMWGLGIGIVLGAVGPLLNFDQGSFLDGFSFLQIVVIIWVCASVAEEVLMRGLVQSYLAPLQTYGISVLGIRISLPVFVAALLFSFIHLVILTTGASGSFVMSIVLFTFTVGLAAGYYRESTGSILPAITIHVFANVGGYGIGRLFELLR